MNRAFRRLLQQRRAPARPAGADALSRLETPARDELIRAIATALIAHPGDDAAAIDETIVRLSPETLLELLEAATEHQAPATSKGH